MEDTGPYAQGQIGRLQLVLKEIRLSLIRSKLVHVVVNVVSEGIIFLILTSPASMWLVYRRPGNSSLKSAATLFAPE